VGQLQHEQYKHTAEFEAIELLCLWPIKRFLIEAESGNPFTGYIKKGFFYYKPRGTNAPMNLRADKLNDLFSSTLSKYTINKSVSSLLEQKVFEIISEKFKDKQNKSALSKTKLNELRTKK
jgi:hypothetical protein